MGYKVSFKVKGTYLSDDDILDAKKMAYVFKIGDTGFLKAHPTGTAIRKNNNVTMFDGVLQTTVDCNNDEKIILEIHSKGKIYGAGLKFNQIQSGTMDLKFEEIKNHNDYPRLIK